MSTPKNIIILGAGKSGTTALFYAVRQAIVDATGKQIEGLFEPTEKPVIAEYLRSGKDVIPLVKVLLGPILRKGRDVISIFDKRIVIYRDPRDNIVSRIVFMLPRVAPRSEAQLIEMFRQKERDPESISVLAMLREIGRVSERKNLPEAVRENSILAARLKQERAQDLFLMPYDDMVEGRFGALNAYLNLDVKPGVEVAQRHSFVVRTKGSGEWRNWFLEEDVQFFAKDVADEFAILGFEANEAPSSDKKINPATTSEYVSMMFARELEKRREKKRKAKAEAV